MDGHESPAFTAYAYNDCQRLHRDAVRWKCLKHAWQQVFIVLQVRIHCGDVRVKAASKTSNRFLQRQFLFHTSQRINPDLPF